MASLDFIFLPISPIEKYCELYRNMRKMSQRLSQIVSKTTKNGQNVSKSGQNVSKKAQNVS